MGKFSKTRNTAIAGAATVALGVTAIAWQASAAPDDAAASYIPIAP